MTPGSAKLPASPCRASIRNNSPYSPVTALIEALKHKSSDKRRNAAIQLGGLREHARDAIPAFQKAEHDGDAKVREAAAIALSRSIRNDFPTRPGEVGRPREVGGSFSKTLIRRPSVPARGLIRTAELEFFAIIEHFDPAGGLTP